MPLRRNYRERVTHYCCKHQLLLLNLCHQSGFFTLLKSVPPKQDPRKIAYILIELAFSTEIFSKRRKICACMKKAQSWSVDYYTECFKLTRHLIVAKIRRLGIPHCIKSHTLIPNRSRGNDYRLALKKVGRSDTLKSSAPQVRIGNFPANL